MKMLNNAIHLLRGAMGPELRRYEEEAGQDAIESRRGHALLTQSAWAGAVAGARQARDAARYVTQPSCGFGLFESAPESLPEATSSLARQLQKPYWGLATSGGCFGAAGRLISGLSQGAARPVSEFFGSGWGALAAPFRGQNIEEGIEASRTAWAIGGQNAAARLGAGVVYVATLIGASLSFALQCMAMTAGFVGGSIYGAVKGIQRVLCADVNSPQPQRSWNATGNRFVF